MKTPKTSTKKRSANLNARYIAVLSHILDTGNISMFATRLITELILLGKIPTSTQWTALFSAHECPANAWAGLNYMAHRIVVMCSDISTRLIRQDLQTYETFYQ